jgi:hypothetical protein
MTAKKTKSSRKHKRRYGPKASRDVQLAMHEMKRGTLRSGRSGKKVTSRAQAIAIGLSEARREGVKVPRRATRSSKPKHTRRRSVARTRRR